MQGGRALARILRRRVILSKQSIPYRPSTHWLLGDVGAALLPRIIPCWSACLDAVGST